MGTLFAIVPRRKAEVLFVLTLLHRCLISNGNFQNSKSFTQWYSYFTEVARSPALPPLPQCHVCPTQLLIAGCLNYRDVKENHCRKNCRTRTKTFFLNLFKNILNKINYKYLCVNLFSLHSDVNNYVIALTFSLYNLCTVEGQSKIFDG